MRRNLTWLLSTLTVVVLLFGYKTSTGGSASKVPAAISAAGTAPSGSLGGSSGPDPGGSAGAASGGSSGSASGGSSGSASGGSSGGSSGTVTGDVVQTRWGPVQVAVSVAGGRVTGVDVVEYPTENPRDQEINSYALPILVKETIARQSADIDMVSGATVTSEGYLQSLQSALDRAGV